MFIMPEEETADAIWLTTEHGPPEHAIAFVKVTPGHTVGQIEIELTPDGAKRMVVTVTYQYTALCTAGEAFVRDFTEAAYEAFMQAWERRLNRYRRTGQTLASYRGTTHASAPSAINLRDPHGPTVE